MPDVTPIQPDEVMPIPEIVPVAPGRVKKDPHSGKLILNPDGSRSMSATGGQRVRDPGGEYCCPPDDEVDCSGCIDPVPRTITVILSGITPCEGCTTFDDSSPYPCRGTYYEWTNHVQLSAAHTLTFYGEPSGGCGWEKRFDVGCVITWWAWNDGCGGHPVCTYPPVTNTIPVIMRFYLTGTSSAVAVDTADGAWTPAWYGTATHPFCNPNGVIYEPINLTTCFDHMPTAWAFGLDSRATVVF